MSQQLNPKMLEQVSKVAVTTALEYLEKEKKSEKKAKRDRRVRNTRLLLKHYRSFKEHCADVMNDLEEMDNIDLSDELDSEEFAVISIRRSKNRTLAMIRFIDKMIQVYQITCEKSSNPIHQRQYRTIHALYIADEEMTIEQISEKNDIDIRTVYRDAKEAVYALSSLIFGVDGVRMIE